MAPKLNPMPMRIVKYRRLNKYLRAKFEDMETAALLEITFREDSRRLRGFYIQYRLINDEVRSIHSIEGWQALIPQFSRELAGLRTQALAAEAAQKPLKHAELLGRQEALLQVIEELVLSFVPRPEGLPAA